MKALQRQVSRRELLRWAATTSLTALAAACTPTPPQAVAPTQPPAQSGEAARPGAQPTGPVAQQVVTLQFWQFGGLIPEIEYLKKRTADWNARNPNIRVEIAEQEWSARVEKIITSFQQGVAPDVHNTRSDTLAELGDKLGIYVPLSEAFPQESQRIKQRLVQQAIDVGTYNNKWWSPAPYLNINTMLAYNRKMFEERGLEPPTTWESLIEIAASLTDSSKGIYGFAEDMTTGQNTSPTRFRYHLYEAGGRFLSEDNKQVLFNSPAGEAVLQFYIDLRKANVMPPNFLELIYTRHTEMFAQGKLAMYPAASWLPALLKDVGAPPDFPWGLAAPPLAGPKYPRGSFPQLYGVYNGSHNWVMTTSSKHKAEAMQFIDFLSSEETIKAWGDGTILGRVPTAKAVLDSAEFQRVTPFLYELWKSGNLFEKRINEPSFPGLSEIDKMIEVMIQEAVLERKPVKQALDEVAAKAQKILDELNG